MMRLRRGAPAGGNQTPGRSTSCSRFPGGAARAICDITKGRLAEVRALDVGKVSQAL